jgi:hypothetical protein
MDGTVPAHTNSPLHWLWGPGAGALGCNHLLRISEACTQQAVFGLQPGVHGAPRRYRLLWGGLHNPSRCCSLPAFRAPGKPHVSDKGYAAALSIEFCFHVCQNHKLWFQGQAAARTNLGVSGQLGRWACLLAPKLQPKEPHGLHAGCLRPLAS